MDAHLPEYELYAIRYAERDARRADHFIGGDPHDGPMPMDYFVWAAIGKERSFVIDTGLRPRSRRRAGGGICAVRPSRWLWSGSTATPSPM
jgi:hypothetical protein